MGRGSKRVREGVKGKGTRGGMSRKNEVGENAEDTGK